MNSTAILSPDAKSKRLEALDTLAVTQAECGEFELGVAYQNKVVELAANDDRLEEFRKRFDLYLDSATFFVEIVANRRWGKALGPLALKTQPKPKNGAVQL